MIMKRILLIFLALFISIFASENEHDSGIVLNFPSITMNELVKFGAKVAAINFTGDPKLLDFEVSFISGKPVSKEKLIQIITQMLEEHDFEVKNQEGLFIIRKKNSDEKLEGNKSFSKTDGKFQVVKLQYHQGNEILDALKQISNDFIQTGSGDDEMKASITSMQWIRSTNSLFFSGSEAAIEKVSKLIESLDVALKQVLIEILVVETSLKNSLDFGLEWSLHSKFGKGSMGAGNFSGSNFPDSVSHLGLSDSDSKILPPILRGFDLGIIGDIIFHKGKSFLSLGSLISALQIDGQSSIVLNQKIVTQENKHSKIFVGDNIPFAGSLVQTVGNGQQTTANVEYRDVGVSLGITPLLGDGDVITLEISEEITEATDHLIHKANQLSGIKTSKTNMSTSAHVPDGHFLILSGMTKSVKQKAVSGPPCLGGIPLIGNLFKKNEKNEDKKNLMIFVRPHIIRSLEEYRELSKDLEASHLVSNR
jgi:type III secretion protein C